MSYKITPLKDLNLSNDYLFCKVMEDEEICRRTLQLILPKIEIKIAKIVKQKQIDEKYLGRGIRLDIYVEDVNGNIYDTEMQAEVRKDLPKRSRYYQAQIDINQVPMGIVDYNALRKSFVIFICTFDIFGKERCVYTFENRCLEEESLTLGDETVKIFLNTKGKDIVSKELRAFLDYVENSCDEVAEELDDPFVNMLNQVVKTVKSNSRIGEEYMTIEQKMMELEARAKAEGKIEGEEQLNELYRKLMKEKRLDDLGKAMEDKQYRQTLYQQFGMNEKADV